MNNKELLGKRFKEIRLAFNLTQSQMAEIAGIEPASISKIETGKNFPLLKNLEKIALKLGIGIDDFFKFNHKKPRKQRREELINLYDKLDEENCEKLYKVIEAISL